MRIKLTNGTNFSELLKCSPHAHDFFRDIVVIFIFLTFKFHCLLQTQIQSLKFCTVDNMKKTSFIKFLVALAISLSSLLESSALTCNSCSLFDNRTVCSAKLDCPLTDTQLCETSISKIEGDYTVTFSCATTQKCGLTLGLNNDTNFALCKYNE